MIGDKASPEYWAKNVGQDQDFIDEFNFVVNNNDVKEEDEEFTTDVFGDAYLNMELALPRADDIEPQFAHVTKRLKDAEGRPIGVANEGPKLDTCMYELEYHDGYKESLSSNMIAQTLFAQVDNEGNCHVLLDAIIDNRVDGSELNGDGEFITISSGTQRRR